ncbi:hypothetical protein IW146_008027 [Coemansia sp. RSA 922]|nr:hypothetical protein IW146_008027 [Coemansia sp. RSA 922]
MTRLLSTKSTTELAHIGLGLVNMRVVKRLSAGQNATLVTLMPSVTGGSLPNTILRTGDIIKIDEAVNDHVIKPFAVECTYIVSGTITSITGSKLVVHFSSKNDIPGHWDERCSVTKLALDVPYKHMFMALDSLANFDSIRPSLHYVMFSNVAPTFHGRPPLDRDFVNKSLNQLQREAVHLAMTADNIALIHGLPGTGKTQVLVEIIHQALARNQRVLVCGPSNVSVDNLVEHLAATPDISMVRISHPARILPRAKEYGLESMMGIGSTGRREPGSSINELADMLSGIMLGTGCSNYSSHLGYYRTKSCSEIIRSKKVVLTTLCSTGSRDLAQNSGTFDVVIVDEATQAIEGECWIAALKAPKLILAGDHLQLPPTVKSIDNSKPKTSRRLDCRLLQVTLFERMLSKHGGTVACMLQTQYRMHADIAKVPSESLYESKLVAHNSVAAHVLGDLEHVESNALTCTPLVHIETAGCGMAESSEEFDGARDGEPGINGSESKANMGEAQQALAHAERLIAAGVSAKDIAVITPYSTQVRLLKRLMQERYSDLEIGSVDGFQGREKEAVILSMVRSNPNKDAGFLKDYRHINVAITRAKRHLCIVADSSTASHGNSFLQALFTHLKAKAFVCPPTTLNHR